MASAIERLKAFAHAAAIPLTPLERRVLAETGLPVVDDVPLDPVQAAVNFQLLPLSLRGDHAGIAAAFDCLFRERAFTGTGYRTYRIAHELIMTADDGAGRADRWQRDRTDPIAAAAHALALLDNASARVEDSTAMSANASRLRDACGEARRVLAFAGPRGRRHWAWRQADFMLTFAACTAGMEDDDLLVLAFVAVQALDPHEFGIYDDRTLQLLALPTEPAGAIDQFAKAAADRTAGQFGDLLYARVYDRAFEHIDPAETAVDAGRLVSAFADWHQRFPSQTLANRFAAHAHAFGDLVTLERLFRGAVREIHPSCWFDRDQPLEAWRSVSGRAAAG